MISLRNIFFNTDNPRAVFRAIWRSDVRRIAAIERDEIPATYRPTITSERSSGSCLIADRAHGISGEASAISTRIASGIISIGIFDRGMDFRQNLL